MKAAVLFLKAAIPGGAVGDLFARVVPVRGHTRADGVFIAPHQATRMVRPLAADAPTYAAPCPYCGEPAHAEVIEAWSDHNFMLDTCCEAMRDVTTRRMQADPIFAASMLDGAGVGAGNLRRVTATNEGYGPVLMDWHPTTGPIGRREAMAFVSRWHRHNPPLPADVFRAGVWNGPTLLGVVVVGIPTARAYMPAFQAKQIIEVRRVAIRTDLPRELTWKAASTLYRHAAAEAERRGFHRIITYTLRDEESGMSLRYARWRPEAETSGGSWNTPSRPRSDKAPTGAKVRWSKSLSPQRPGAAT